MRSNESEGKVSVLLPIIRGLIFDLDGTFINSPEMIFLAMAKTAQELKLPRPTWGKFRMEWGKSWVEILKAFWPGDFERVRDLYAEKNKIQAYQLYPGVEDALSSLRSKKIAMAIVSDRYHLSMLKRLGQINLPLDYFTAIQGMTENHQPKPAKDLFETVWPSFAALGIRKYEAAYVGGLVKDAKAARNFGVHFIAYCSGLTTKAAFHGAGVPGNCITESPKDWLKFV
jgi:phosphoglycolate phosphatase-like HAD superfamily hydrolase